MEYPGCIERIGTEGRNIFRLASAKLKAGGSYGVVGGTYDGRVCAFDTDGKLMWDVPTGGFVFDVSAGDINGDGFEEVLAASSDCNLYIFGADGRLLWKRDMGGVVLNTVAAKLDGVSPVIAACGAARLLTLFTPEGEKLKELDVEEWVIRLCKGDFDGDGMDELLIVSSKKSLPWNEITVRIYKGLELELVLSKTYRGWKADTGYGGEVQDISAEGKHGFDCTVYDVNGDGVDELVTSTTIISFTDEHGKLGGPAVLTRLEQPLLPKERYDFYYRMKIICCGRLDRGENPVVVSLFGPDIIINDAVNGKCLGWARGPQGFSDIVYVPDENKNGNMWLGSSPNGDDSLYRSNFLKGWKESFKGLMYKGVIAETERNIDTLNMQVRSWKGQRVMGQKGPFVIDMESWKIDGPEELVSEMSAFHSVKIMKQLEERFPYSNLRLAANYWISEKDIPPMRDGQPWGRDRRLKYLLSAEDIVSFASYLEKEGVYFLLTIGHGCHPFIRVETAEKLIKAAPTHFLGFVTAEDGKDADSFKYYMQHYINPIMDFCLDNEKFFILREKNTFWASLAAMPEIHDVLFDEKYCRVLVPCVEDSNSRTPDINLAARVGLWLSCKVEKWCVRACSDYLSWNRAWDFEYPMVGHPWLRYLTGQAVLGASVYMLNLGLLNGDEYTRIFSEGVEPFIHMLGKGIIAPPERGQLKSISPVVLSVINPSERFVATGLNGHDLAAYHNEKCRELEPAVFGQLSCYWGLSGTKKTDAGTYLWGRTRQFANYLPVSEGGFVAVAPGYKPDLNESQWSKVVITDGDNFYNDDGTIIPLDEARGTIIRELKSGERSFKLSVKGDAYYQVVEYEPGRYVVYLVDREMLQPKDQCVSIKAEFSDGLEAYDRLTGDMLDATGGAINMRIPSGCIAIVEVRNKNEIL